MDGLSQYFTSEMTEWRNANTNKHLCKCGCGQFVQPTRWRWYNGKNLDYIAGHNPASYHCGENNYLWKGGRRTKSDGYVLVFCPNHPKADKRGYVREHRLVMEGILGRYLEDDEDVHHINKIRSDNRSENLRLMSVVEHHRLHIGCKDKNHKWVGVSAEEILLLRELGFKFTEIAQRLNISEATIYRRLRTERRIPANESST
jgi:hypothetical protein